MFIIRLFLINTKVHVEFIIESRALEWIDDLI